MLRYFLLLLVDNEMLWHSATGCLFSYRKNRMSYLNKEFNDILEWFLMVMIPTISNSILEDYDFFKSSSSFNSQKFNMSWITVESIKNWSIQQMMKSVWDTNYDLSEYINVLNQAVNYSYKKSNFDKQRVVLIIICFMSFMLARLHKLYWKEFTDDEIEILIRDHLRMNNFEGLMKIYIDENRKKNGWIFMRVQLWVVWLLSLPILYYAYSISMLHWSWWIILLVFSTICHNFIFRLLNTVWWSVIKALLSMCIVTIPFSFVFYYLSKWLLSWVYVVWTFGGWWILMSWAVHAWIVILVSLILWWILAFRDEINE